MGGNYFSNDTIVAVATSLSGDGGVGVIRLSGPDSLKCAQKITSGFEEPSPRFLHRIDVCKPETKQVIDDGLAVYFPNQQSFTGEEVVELQVHGGRVLLQNILQLLLKTGFCRLALAGEFSFRAVRNGKMSLDAAQSLNQIISAKSPFEIESARRSINKNRIGEFDQIAKELQNLLAQIELSIDFLDQDVEIISQADFSSRIKVVLNSLDKMKAQMTATSRIAKGISVSIVGAPNAGKSTFFNAILAEERSIVSSEAGTTRDVVTEEVILGPYYVRFADTAGLRISKNQIESEGISRAKELAKDSDIAILVMDATLTFDKILEQLHENLKQLNISVLVLNKSDLLKENDLKKLEKQIQAEVKNLPFTVVAAAQQKNITHFLSLLKSTIDQKFHLGLNSFLPTEFQFQMVFQCMEALNQTETLIAKTGTANPELISVSLHSALKAISDLVGETTPDTVLTKIFSEFCIGK